MNVFKSFATDVAREKFVGHWGAMYFDSSDKESVEKLQSVRDNLFNIQKIGSRMNRADFGDIFPKNQIECEAYDLGENGIKIRNIAPTATKASATKSSRTKRGAMPNKTAKTMSRSDRFEGNCFEGRSRQDGCDSCRQADRGQACRSRQTDCQV